MALVDRAKNICVTPNTEWPKIAAEPASSGGLLTGYAIPLMAVSAAAGFIGSTMIGVSAFGASYRTPIVAGLVGAIFSLVIGIVGLFILSFIINALAPTFGGQQDSTQAMKVAVYSYTPAWIAGLLGIIPFLGVLAIIGGLYGLYLLYLGLPVLMKSPPDKTMGYTVVVVVAAIVVQLVLGGIVAMVGIGAVGAGAVMGGRFGAMNSSPSGSEVTFDKDSPLGKLEELGKAMEKSSKEMEAANKSGDANAAAAAAGNMLGTMFGGGKKVDPLELDQLKAFVPDTFAGYAKQGNGSAEKNGIAGLMVSKVEARYGDGNGKDVELEIVDSGGASGLMGLANWAGVAAEKEDDSGKERTRRVDGRWTHERDSKDGTDEYAVMVGERFMVTARSSDVELGDLRSAVSKLNLSKLESMKDVGVQKQ